MDSFTYSDDFTWEDYILEARKRREQIKVDRESGMSIYAIANKYGISRQRAHQIVKKLKLKAGLQ